MPQSRSRSFSRSPRNSALLTFGLFSSSGGHQQPTLPSHSTSASQSHLDVIYPSTERQRSLSTGMPTPLTTRGMRRLEARRQMEETNFLTSKARSQNLNPPVDLRLLDYVTTYDDNLMCAICRCPFVDPVVLAECDHYFCRDCIRQTWGSTYTPLGPRGDCPSCRTPAKLGPRSATSKILVNILDDLLVRCPRHEDGCRATIKRGEVLDHVNIYCGFTYQECPGEGCELSVRRKDALEGCLHYGVSCLDCHEAMQKSNLEKHWRSECAIRRITCPRCGAQVLSKELEYHNDETCEAVSIPCPGASIGCTGRSKRSQAQVHARSCTFAKLAPVIAAQKQRMDEQEVAQRLLSRKLEVMEDGFAAMQSILYPKQLADIDDEAADESRIPFLEPAETDEVMHSGHRRVRSMESVNEDLSPFTFPVPPQSRPSSTAPGTSARHAAISMPPSRPPPPTPGPRPENLPEPYSADFDLASPGFPPPAAHGPYASPLHHLLSMHESLRDEMSRISSAVQELDGRHSMHTLNENLRTREEISYLGAQLAGLSRQVHWLTSAQLQRQSRSGTPATGVTGPSSDLAGAGAGVEAAVSAVNSATTVLRGAARMVNLGQGSSSGQMRRENSAEGRTKL